jgi:hypothetical protein
MSVQEKEWLTKEWLMITVVVVWDADQGLALMLLLRCCWHVKSRTNHTKLGSSGRKYPSVYFVVLLTRTKAFY